MVGFAVDLGQAHANSRQVVDADLGRAERLFRVCDCRGLRDIAHHVATAVFHAWRLAVVATVLISNLSAWDCLEVSISPILVVSRLWQTQLEDVLLQLDRPEKL